MKTADKTITNAVVTALLVAAVVTTGCDESDSSVVQAMRFLPYGGDSSRRYGCSEEWESDARSAARHWH